MGSCMDTASCSPSLPPSIPQSQPSERRHRPASSPSVFHGAGELLSLTQKTKLEKKEKKTNLLWWSSNAAATAAAVATANYKLDILK